MTAPEQNPPPASPPGSVASVTGGESQSTPPKAGEGRDPAGQKEHDISAKGSDATPEEFQKKLETRQDTRRDKDFGSEQAELRKAKRFRKNQETRIGAIRGGHIEGGVGSTTYIDNSIHYHSEPAPAEAPGPTSEAGKDEMPWPASAFEVCCENIDDAAFLVSAAVLEGFSVGTVRMASVQLARRLSSEIKLPDNAPRPAPRLRSIDSLFSKFHIHISKESDEHYAFAECVRFVAPTEAAEILLHSWTRLSGFPRWTEHLTGWLRDMGSDDSQDVRAAAGAAAGILWSSGISEIERDTAEHWYSDESTLPLDALDGCYATAALASPKLHERINARLWAWGHITYGIDDVYALRHLSTRRYRQVDPRACFTGLEALLGRNNMLGLIHAQDAYEWLFAAGIDEPDSAREVAESLLRVLAKAVKDRDTTLRLQAIIVMLSLVEAERSKRGERFFVFDRVLATTTDLTRLAELGNATIAGSPVQPSAITALRQLYMRGATGCPSYNWLDSPILRFFSRMYETGDTSERERLAYYLQDWSEAAAEKSPLAGIVTDGLIGKLHQGAV